MTLTQAAILLLMQSSYSGCKSKYIQTIEKEKHYVAVCKNNNGKATFILPLKVGYGQNKT